MLMMKTLFKLLKVGVKEVIKHTNTPVRLIVICLLIKLLSIKFL
jgi:hypothetical protein